MSREQEQAEEAEFDRLLEYDSVQTERWRKLSLRQKIDEAADCNKLRDVLAKGERL